MQSTGGITMVDSLVRYFPASVVGVTGLSASVSRLVLSFVSSLLIRQSCLDVKQFVAFRLLVVVAYYTY